MSIGALAFLNPWLLAALASLPLIYWLLRTVPPRPQQVDFPATRILVGLPNLEKTPARTPWWLWLIRLVAAALVILALAEPVLNPARDHALKGTGPLALVIDNGWSAAAGWARRKALAERFMGEAQAQSRPVMIVETAPAAKSRSVRLEAPSDARATLQGLAPQPFAPDRKASLAALQTALGQAAGGDPTIVWLGDGIDHDGAAGQFAQGLASASRGGTFAFVEDQSGLEPLGLVAGVGANGTLTAKVIRTGGPAREGSVHAFSARGQWLGDAAFKLGAGESATEIGFDLPLELRNQVTRLTIDGDRSAGAVSLLDGRSQWQRVGTLSGESQEQAQPLLAPLYYINKAIQPFAEIISPKDHNLAQGVDAALKQNASVLVLADIGTISGDVKDRVEAWVKRGGVLVRFAGPRLENGGDDLLPVALRTGGRTLGGALSWSTQQPLAPFDDASLFAGLTAPGDVTIRRQVLADPALLTPEVKVWARLQDGTPLVTAASRGAGQIVLFHITANSDWSNLPLSGLFVEMLRRITALGSLSAAAGGEETTAAGVEAQSNQQAGVLAPTQTLDGFGVLQPAPPTAEAIPAAKISAAVASLSHPPGYYGAQGSTRSLNIITPETKLAALPEPPQGSERLPYESLASTPLMPILLALALLLVFADIIAVLLLLGAGAGVLAYLRPVARAGSSAAVVAALAIPLALSLAANTGHALAQEPRDKEAAPLDSNAIAQKATGNVTLGYVLTGDATTDQTSRAGLSGLSRVLATRTAVEPGEPMGVDIVKDEIAFFPVLYWPVVENATALPQPTLAKIDAFMKQGGMIVFDTRDFGTGLSGTRLSGKNGAALQRLLGSLDVPRLETVPETHVLTKSFYLLHSFPGRWDGGELWVEASADGESEGGQRKARLADGVTSIMITSNDFASAWALDSRGRPLYPVAPGGEGQREMALRTGINIVMHALTGNYKADQVHVPALLERLGQ
ncbi:MAG: DUF4159 domain-containing protein [Hyphomicrobium sp.]|jgi:hypothetical protein